MKNLILDYLTYNNITVPENFEELEIEQLEELFDIRYDQIDECYINSCDLIYCEIEDIMTHIDNTIYCEFSGNYFTDNNYHLIDVIGARGKQISSYYYSNNEYSNFGLVILYNGELCLHDRACFVESEGEYYEENECYYWESDNEWHLDPEEEALENRGEFNFPYHGSNPPMYAGNMDAKIGFEVEKEDEYIKTQYRAKYLQAVTGWGKENDGSLDGRSGFELVSPCYSLHQEREYFIDEFNKVRDLLNADYSNDRCGGHINYSNPNYRPIDLLNAVKGYFPLLYALYPHRINKTYCKAKSPEDLIRYSEKYQSVCIKDRCIEFRVFGAVKSMKNLLWRLELIQIIDLYKTEKPSTVLLYMSDESHPLYSHLTKIYNHEKLALLIEKFEKYSKQFHNVYLDNRILKEIDNRLTLKIIKEKTNLY